LLVENFASAIARGALHHSAIWFGARTLATRAGLQSRDLQIGRQPAHGIFKADLQVIAQIFTALDSRPAPLPAPEQIAKPEEISQDVPEIGKCGFVEAGTRRSVHGLMSVAVVGRALLRIAEDAVGLGSFLKLLLGLFVVRVAVRMILKRQLPISAL
jgi:hypothetical protein